MKNKQLFLFTLLCLAASNTTAFSMWARYARPMLTRVVRAAQTTVKTKPTKVAAVAGFMSLGGWWGSTCYKRSYTFQQPCVAKKLEVTNFAGKIHVNGWDKQVLHVQAIARANSLQALQNTSVSVETDGDTTRVTTHIKENDNPENTNHNLTEYKTPNGTLYTNSSVIIADDATITEKSPITQTNDHIGNVIHLNKVQDKNISYWNNVQGANVDYTIWAPRTLAALIAMNQSGDIHAKDLNNVANIASQSGNVTVTNCTNAQAATQRGNATVHNATDAHAATQVGNVHAFNVIRKFVGRSNIGNITIEKSTATVDARTYIGNVLIK